MSFITKRTKASISSRILPRCVDWYSNTLSSGKTQASDTGECMIAAHVTNFGVDTSFHDAVMHACVLLVVGSPL